MNTNRDVWRAIGIILLVWLVAFVVLGCATERRVHGNACPSYQAGWIESRRGECDVWRCNAATLRWERLEVCG